MRPLRQGVMVAPSGRFLYALQIPAGSRCAAIFADAKAHLMTSFTAEWREWRPMLLLSVGHDYQGYAHLPHKGGTHEDGIG